MAAPKTSPMSLTSGEKSAGLVFFILYLIVFPFLVGQIYSALETLLDTLISDALGSAIYYYLLFAATVVIFHTLLAKSSRELVRNLDRVVKVCAVALIAFYGLNELVYRLFSLAFGDMTNLNNVSIASQVQASPHVMILIIVFLCPVIEETLFRGLVFGGLHEHSRFIAYAASCLLFALLHVWQYALLGHDVSYFLLTIQYLVPGLVFAWAYERTGTLWTPIIAHICVNALSIFFMLK
jgi:uncharacterized protein